MEERFWKTFQMGFLIGYIASFLLAIVVLISCCMRGGHVAKKRNKVMDTPMMASLMERRERKTKEAIEEISKLEKSIPRLSFRMLYDATDGFCHESIVGIGKMWTVYKGKFAYNCFMAVKSLNESHNLEKGFISKLIILSRLKHNNMVPFLGFCTESSERFLICYKYMSNGKLYDWLHPADGRASFLEWPTRAFIATKVAKGLAHLHNNDYPTAHVNLSSRRILLDKNFEPKISNFDEAVFISNNCIDFFGSVFKEDVYRFGILLLELVTGEDPVRNHESFHSLKRTLLEQTTDLSANSFSSLSYLVDKSVIGRGYELEIMQFLRVAYDCLQTLPDHRPTMIQVYRKLLGVWHIAACQYQGIMK